MSIEQKDLDLSSGEPIGECIAISPDGPLKFLDLPVIVDMQLAGFFQRSDANVTAVRVPMGFV